MPVMVPIMLPRPRLISMKKNMTDQNGEPGKWVMASVKAMKAKPVPCTACVEPTERGPISRQTWYCQYRFGPETHLVELVLQDTGVQTQLSEPALFNRLDDAVHLGVV